MRAREEQADTYADEIVELSDDATPETAQAVRLQIDARKWVAAKLLPKKYGDRANETHFTAVTNNIVMPIALQEQIQERRAKALTR